MVSVQGTPLWVALKVLPAMLTVPLRGVIPGLAVALNVTLLLPDPVAPAVTVIHEALLVAPQVHPAGAVTATVVASPAGAKSIDPGAIVSVQAMPACVALKVLPAIVTEPDREAVLVLAAAATVTEPFAGAVTVSHELLLVAVQVQPAGAVTVTGVLSPAVANAHDAGEIVSLHVSPACVALKVWPAIVTEPDRDAVLVLAAAATVTEPFAGAVTVSHELLLVAVQVQPVGAVTVTGVLSPPVANAHDAGEIVSLHVSAAWVALNVLPAMVTEPEREADPVLAAAATVTVPGPEPLAPAVTVSQELLLVAFQPQAPGAVTEMSVLSPAVANAFDAGEIVSLQEMPVCVTVKLTPAIVSVPVLVVVDVFASTP